MHLDVLVATDFFTTEVWTWCELVTYDVLFFIRISTREVHVAGVTPHPDQHWMTQMARNVTMADWDVLGPGQYLLHDRDGKYCPAFQQTVDAAGVTRVPLPPRSPNLNAYAERWVRLLKEAALSQLILLLSKLLADLGQGPAVAIGQSHAACDPMPKDAVLGHQKFVPQQQLLIDGPL